MKMRPLRLVAGAGALAAGTAAGSAAFAVPEAAAAQAADAAAPAPAPLTLTDVAGPDLYGAPTTFTLTVTNRSETAAVSQPDLSDVLPAGVTYVAPPPPPPPVPAAPPAGATTGAPGLAPSTSSSTGVPGAPAVPVLTAAPVSPTPPPPPLPTVTVNPNGTTTLDWSGLAPIAAGGHLSLSFSAQPDVAPASDAYLPGSVFSDSATVQAGSPQQQAATAAATVAVTTATVTQSATPLPSTTKTGTVMDTIRLDGAPLADSTGVVVDLYLPDSVELGACPAPAPPSVAPASPSPATPTAPGVSGPPAAQPAGPPPPPCVLPSWSFPQTSVAAPDGTPAWPLATGKTSFVDLEWAPGPLAANAHQSFTVPLQVTNPADWTGVSPAVLAVLIASQTSTQAPVPMAPVTNKLTVGTTPPPPPPPPSPKMVAINPAPLPVGPGVTAVAATAPTPAVSAHPALPAASGTTVHDAVVTTGPTVNPTPTAASPFSPRPATVAAGAPSAPTAVQPAPSSAGRDPFLVPGQVDAPAIPAAPVALTPVSGVPALGIQTTAAPAGIKSSNLAYTGMDAEGLGGMAGVLLTAGAGLVLVTRRRTGKTAPSGS